MIAGKEIKMAKVEMPVGDWPIGYGRAVPATRGPVNVGALVDDGEVSTEYADKTWEEFVTFNVIEDLIGKRKVIQRKLDAARKRLKRLANRLNVIEGTWNPA